MNEASWLTTTNVRAMLAHLTKGGRYSARKMRLFSCACARQGWHLLADVRSRKAVEVAERYADILATDTELSRARSEATIPVADAMLAVNAAWQTCRADSGQGASGVLSSQFLDGATLAATIHEVFGNPFRPIKLPEGPKCKSCDGRGEVRYCDAAGDMDDRPCEGCGGWVGGGGYKNGRGHLGCPWITEDVKRLAQAAYEIRPGRQCEKCGGKGSIRWNLIGAGGPEDRDCASCHSLGTIEDGQLDSGTLAALSDALEEAGCDNMAILSHLRRPAYCVSCQGTGEGTDEYAGRSVIHGGCPRCRGNVGPHFRGCFCLDLILGNT